MVPARRVEWPAGAAWGTAAVLAAVATAFPLMSAVIPSAAYSGAPSTGAKAFDLDYTYTMWGGIDVVADPPDPDVVVAGAFTTDYGPTLLVCAVILAMVAVATVVPGRLGRWAVVTSLGPVAAGALGGIGATQLLTYQTLSRPQDTEQVPTPPSASWQLLPGSWLVVASAATALYAWYLVARRRSPTEAPAEALSGARIEPPVEPPVEAIVDPTVHAPGEAPAGDPADPALAAPTDLTVYQRPDR